MKKNKNYKTDMTLEERYKLLIEARNFHYDNFNKWMTYFYVAIGSLFIGYCTVISSEKLKVDSCDIERLILILGFIVSLLWYWSAKGHYYWNINFINLVNYYEENLLNFDKKQRVYFMFSNKKTQNNYFSPISGANISTSKVAILFAFIISTVWLFIFLNKTFHDFPALNKCCCDSPVIFQIILSVIIVVLLSWIIPTRFLKSYHKHFHDLKINV